MAQLGGRRGRTHFLLVANAGQKKRTITFHERFDAALGHWQAGARISPVFDYSDDATALPRSDSDYDLIFAGPIYPGAISDTLPGRVLLTLGVYNTLFLLEAGATKDRSAVTAWCEEKALPWEHWQIREGKVDRTNRSAREPQSLPAHLRKVPGLNEASLLPTEREYALLIATAVGQASIYFEPLRDWLLQFDQHFRALLRHPRLPLVEKQGCLVIANAALSRHTSQTYAGSSPILATECHYWTHSLLGIGIASAALFNVYNFLNKHLSAARITDRLRALALLPSPANLFSLNSMQDFWQTSHLFSADVEKVLPPFQPDDHAPLITFFSGRDGFRSTALSLSAPLECITGCATPQWTLQTATHEFTHTLVAGALGILVPDPNDTAKLTAFANSLESKNDGGDFLSALQRFTCYHVARLHLATDGDVTATIISEAIRERLGELNELLTHAVDFLLFYQSDVRRYISSIWASWGVIPNVTARTREYVIRTLCAVHCIHLRQKGGADLTYKRVVEELGALAKITKSDLLDAALDQLSQDEADIKKDLGRRIPLVKLARAFLYQEELAGRLWKDEAVGAGGRYAVSATEFTAARVTNPLRFLVAFSSDGDASAPKAAWLLHMLAFPAGEST